MSGLTDLNRIYSLTVDSSIPRDKIFLNISYVGTDLNGVSFKSGWNDSAIIDIRENLSGAVLDKIVYPIFSPLKQFKSGIKIDEIQCKDDLVLILKFDGSPACVTYGTANKLIQREWTICSDEIKYYRGHPCGIRSSPGISSDNS